MKKLMNVFAVVLCAICAQAVEFDYDVNADGTITLSGVRGSVPPDLVIPSEIEGRVVTGIGAKFCEECDSLRSVKFPDSIKTVADHSFDECGKLKSVELNEGLLEIGRKAFCECPIETLELPSTLESVGEGAFTRSNIPGPLFSKSTSGLKSISIRYGDNSRFEACGGNGLYDKQGKRLIVVSPYATSFRVPDGCEFIGHTALLCSGNLTSIAFPESLTEIDDEAFAACVKLTTLDFSRTKLKRVSEQAFCGCIELISVSFPATLVEIGGGAFCGANKLRTVRFLGNAPYVNVDYEKSFRENIAAEYADQNQLFRHTRLTYLEVEALQHKLWGHSMLSQITNFCYSFIPFSAPDGVTMQVLSNGKGALATYVALMLDVKTNAISVVYDIQDKMISAGQLMEFHNTYLQTIEKFYKS